ncbi:MAG: hypothetical protein ACTHMX_15875 [Thermomicrobiales bacterium]
MTNVLGLVAFCGAVVVSATGAGVLWKWDQRRAAAMAAAITILVFALGMAYFL